ncbi:MAG: J domain-containing protein [Elainellaceae cyanobacterium]
MDISTCYRLLNLNSNASYRDVKASYRALARRYHPDANPDNVDWAKAKFIELTQAYRMLTEALSASPMTSPSASPSASPAVPPVAKPQESRSPAASAQSAQRKKTDPKRTIRVTRKAVKIQADPNLSSIDNRLKQQTYHQLQEFLQTQRFPRAIALVDGLAQRLPNDAEVRQWQAIAYQRWAHHLIEQRNYSKARIYLKKALKADPHNRVLWTAVRRDFDRLEQLQVRRSL